MCTPDDVERAFTLSTAVARYEKLRTRDALAPAGEQMLTESADELTS